MARYSIPMIYINFGLIKAEGLLIKILIPPSIPSLPLKKWLSGISLCKFDNRVKKQPCIKLKKFQRVRLQVRAVQMKPSRIN